MANDSGTLIAKLEVENRELRELLRSVKDEARRNAEVFHKMRERELELMKAESLPQLLRYAVDGLRASYGLDALALVLEDPQHEIRHLLFADGHRPEEFHGVAFVDSVVGLAPQVAVLARPWLGLYVPSDHQLLFPGAANVQSLALVPLTLGTRLVGVLALGSADDRRFTRHHATDFLAHLGVIVAHCLDSACNRARLIRAGLTDYLTGWHNRRYLQTRLKEELARARRQHSAVSLLMIDLDHFKQINDRHGHLAGDQAIREVACRIEGQIRASDAAARFGGDEFAVLLPGTGVEDAARLAARIGAAVSDTPVELATGEEGTLTLSIGVAGLAGPELDGDHKSLGERLFADADAALYRAKAAGRARFEVAR